MKHYTAAKVCVFSHSNQTKFALLLGLFCFLNLSGHFWYQIHRIREHRIVNARPLEF